MSFIAGQRYDLKIVFAQPNSNRITVDLGGDDGWSQQVVEGDLTVPVQSLKNKTVSFVCREVTEKGAIFDLAPEYFKSDDAAQAQVGANSNRVPLAKLPDVEEGEKVEFKTSIIYSPITNQPHSDQPFAIAKEIAAFMNTDGGTLYLGVTNDGGVCGIEGDYPVLGQAVIKMPDKTDADYGYKPTRDGYEQKLRNLIRFYLGEYASSLIKDPEWGKAGGRTYVKLTIPATGEEIIYLGREELLVYRTGSESVHLIGRARDQYTKVRFHHGQVFDIKAMLEEFKNSLVIPAQPDPPPVKIPDNASIPLDKAHLDAIRSPGGLVFDGSFCGEAKSWSDLYLRLLEKLASVDPDKFKALPDESSLRLKGGRTLFAQKGNRTHFDKASPYLGPDGVVRADLAVGTKAGFYLDTGVPLRLIRHFGLKPEQFRIWTGNK
ncbi:MAG: ATP-binding protein [Kiritimatiellae bacterium]|nr:ATP-binding protein [Kiritimatiellia bacterium]